MTDDRFRLVGVRPQSPAAPVRRAPWYRGKPIFSAAVLTLIVLGCLFCEVLLTHDPTRSRARPPECAPAAGESAPS